MRITSRKMSKIKIESKSETMRPDDRACLNLNLARNPLRNLTLHLNPTLFAHFPPPLRFPRTRSA